MENNESFPDDTDENRPHQPVAYGGYSSDSRHRPPSREHAGIFTPVRSLTHGVHHHHEHGDTSANIDYQKKRRSAFTNSLDEVINELRNAGLKSSNLILGIDFTHTLTEMSPFFRRNYHAIGYRPNPYEQVISIIGRTLSPFNEDNLIHCFGFGDETTLFSHVFSFYPDHRPCNGFEEALARYREILPYMQFGGWPTSFAPVIDAATGIVEKSNFQYHVLVIITQEKVSPGNRATIDAIVAASNYPLSIILVEVGDGPWDCDQTLFPNISPRVFDNFQFVIFSRTESAFARDALMNIRLRYKATMARQYEQKNSLRARKQALPPPREVIELDDAKKLWESAASVLRNYCNARGKCRIC